MAVLLTPEQQEVVAHNHGPALVFAVAGAGKTTAMVHRIARLVRDQIFQPHRILATSFSRATVADIRKALNPHAHCQDVHVATLHSVGLQVLRRTQQRGLIERLEMASDEGAMSEKQLLKRVLGKARQQRLEIPNSFDEQDFLSFVGVCKGNFAYPHPQKLKLPPAAMALVKAVEAPEQLDYYADLYTLYEQTRQDMGLVTFDDMLLSAWEVLHQYPDLLTEQQKSFDCVLVDEFQDVNAVQNELLDLLSAQHRNYMVIGDDDQTIYEWRGASPRYILDFPQRYRAVKYLLRENFRSQASHLALANRIIVHNQQREPKQLLLTRGFEGRTVVRSVSDEQAQARQLIVDLMSSCQSGYQIEQQAVLVRLYAQTPFIEQALIEAYIPYKIVGSVPFYQRSEIRTLLAYLDLARYERQLRSGTALISSQLEGLHRRWYALANRPVRYLNRHWMDWVFERIKMGQSLVTTLEALATNADTAYQAKLVRVLAEILDWLATDGLEQETGVVLRRLEQDLKYCQYLRKSSGFPETGEGRAMTVEAFLDYSQNMGSLTELEAHLEHLARDHREDQNSLTITTIFRSKGLEWPVVYIPHCNQGYIPYTSAHSIEEERRLFYVALTRPREHLYLYVLQNHPLSRFLTEASWQQTLEQVQETRRLLSNQLDHWSLEELLALARNSKSLVLQRYLEHWWQAPIELRQALHKKMAGLLHAAQSQNLLEPLQLNTQDMAHWQGPVDPAAVDEYESGLQALTQDLMFTAQGQSFMVGQSVWCERFGRGRIIGLDSNARQGDVIEVNFEDGETRRLLARYANLQAV